MMQYFRTKQELAKYNSLAPFYDSISCFRVIAHKGTVAFLHYVYVIEHVEFVRIAGACVAVIREK